MHPSIRFSLALDGAETSLHEELAAEVTHISLAEYQIGGERYERLHEAMRHAHRFSWPMNGYEVNL